jgi:hypothetical protein
MKKLLFVLSVFLFSGILVFSCKKGEDDPFISFRSRKARFSGDWHITLLDKRETITQGGMSEIINTDIEEEGVTETTTSGSFRNTRLGRLDVGHYQFKKDGTFTYNYQVTIIENWRDTVSYVDVNNYQYKDTTLTETRIFRASGTWNFLSNVDEYKNKERVILNFLRTDSEVELQYFIEDRTSIPNPDGGNPPFVTSTTSRTDIYRTLGSQTYIEGGKTEIWRLTKLRNKEINAVSEYMNVISTTNEDGMADIIQETGRFTIVLEAGDGGTGDDE